MWLVYENVSNMGTGLDGRAYFNSENRNRRSYTRRLFSSSNFWQKSSDPQTRRWENLLITRQPWQYPDSSENARIVKKTRLERQ